MNPQETAPPKNETDLYLESKGWKLVRKIKGFSTATGGMLGWQAWDHPDHQHDRRGFFQKSEALAHQKRIDKGISCDCIPSEAKR